MIATLNIETTGGLEDGTPPLYSGADLDQLAGQATLNKDDIYALLGRIIDGSRLLEFKKMFGGNLVCGFGFIKGQLTGFLANSGPITAQDAQKGGHFVQLCDNRDMPIVFLQNSSLSSGHTTDAATMKERAKFMHCLSIGTLSI